MISFTSFIDEFYARGVLKKAGCSVIEVENVAPHNSDKAYP